MERSDVCIQMHIHTLILSQLKRQWGLPSFTLAMTGSPAPGAEVGKHEGDRYGGHRKAARREKSSGRPRKCLEWCPHLLCVAHKGHERSGMRAALSPSHQSRARVHAAKTWHCHDPFLNLLLLNTIDLQKVRSGSALRNNHKVKVNPDTGVCHSPWDRSQHCSEQERLQTTHHPQNVRTLWGPCL